MATRSVSTTEFKANPSALFGEMEHTGGTITIKRQGRSIALPSPPAPPVPEPTNVKWKSPVNGLRD